MTIKELYRSFLIELSNTHNSDEAAAIAKNIFEYYAGIDRLTIMKDPDRVLNEKIVMLIKESLEALKKNKPLQYITGEAWFYGMKLKVSPAVLIPRPETEELAAAVIHSLQHKPGAYIIDIGTGSGCIAIAIKKNIPTCDMTAIDISIEALEIAKENAVNEQTNIHFIKTDFLSNAEQVVLGMYDRIISNPPYIPRNEMSKMDKNVTEYEPHIALFVEDNRPLIFYENVLSFANDHLKENGMVFLETHQELAGDVCNLFNTGIYKAIIKKDIFENERMVIVTRCR